MSYMEIDSWARLSEALQFYTDNGCTYVEVPWEVSPQTTAITKPANAKDFPYGSRHVLVGSAEQSFLEMYNYVKEIGGICVALTPCFRDEYEDILHQRYFHKIELFSTNPSDDDMIYQLAMNYMDDKFGGELSVVEILSLSDINMHHACDIMYKDIELGSYGVRSHGEMIWAYGTGLAEPRFTTALKMYKESI